MKYTIFFVLICGILPACKQTTEKIPTRFNAYVRYIQPDGSLTAEARLVAQRPGEPERPYLPAGGVLYQGSLLTALPIDSTVLRTSRSGAFPDNHRFSWKNPDGTDNGFEFGLSPVSAFRFEPNPIQLDKPAVFTWEGDPLEGNESLIFMWQNLKDNRTQRMEIVKYGASSSIQFPAAKLRELEKGDWVLYLVRRKLVKAVKDGHSLEGLIEYYSHEDTLSVR